MSSADTQFSKVRLEMLAVLLAARWLLEQVLVTVVSKRVTARL